MNISELLYSDEAPKMREFGLAALLTDEEYAGITAPEQNWLQRLLSKLKKNQDNQDARR